MCPFFIPNLNYRRYSQQHHCFSSFCSFCTPGRWGCTQGAMLSLCSHVGGLNTKILLWGSNLAALVFFPFFFFFVYSFEVVFLEPSVSFEGTLSSILQIRDVALFCFLLPSFLDNFPFAHVPTTPDCCLFSSLRLFFFYLQWAYLSFFFLLDDSSIHSFLHHFPEMTPFASSHPFRPLS